MIDHWILGGLLLIVISEGLRLDWAFRRIKRLEDAYRRRAVEDTNDRMRRKLGVV